MENSEKPKKLRLSVISERFLTTMIRVLTHGEKISRDIYGEAKRLLIKL